eukprot:GHUV01048866.1.p1 GENE.GHUV01048866.1~~GHUV01048866.1.p1  ORF type:complete len:119 (+),score=14.73 GHUV01048866.1:385-741(+)
MAPNSLSSDCGTFSSAAVPVAPTPGGKPYSSRASRRSLGGLRRRATHLQEIKRGQHTCVVQQPATSSDWMSQQLTVHSIYPSLAARHPARCTRHHMGVAHDEAQNLSGTQRPSKHCCS